MRGEGGGGRVGRVFFLFRTNFLFFFLEAKSFQSHLEAIVCFVLFLRPPTREKGDLNVLDWPVNLLARVFSF